MLKQLITILFLFFTFGGLYAADVNVNVEIYSDFSIFMAMLSKNIFDSIGYFDENFIQ